MRAAPLSGPPLVVVGGSAGSFDPLCELLAGLRAPELVELAVAVVLHIPRGQPSRLAEVIEHEVERPVVEVEDKTPIAASKIYIAPPSYHVLVDRGSRFALSVEEPVNFAQPSIDVLFESAADVLGPRVAGVVLSGANDDGARGLAAIARAAGLALVQAPETASHRTMPAAALALVPAARVVSIAGMCTELRRFCVRADAALREKRDRQREEQASS